MIRKALLIAGIFYTSIILNGCLLCNCKTASHTYKWTGLNLYNMSYEVRDSMAYARRDSCNDFSTRNYAIDLVQDYELLSGNPKPMGLGFITSANACKCDEDNCTTSNPIVSVRVNVVTDFDNTHLANADCGDLFSVYTYDAQLGRTVLKDLGNGNRSIVDQSRYCYFVRENSFVLFLKQKPQLAAMQQFEVTVTLSDGTMFTKQTGGVVLK